MMINSLRDAFRPMYHALLKVVYRIKGVDVTLPVIRHSFPLNRVGTHYGGWNFVESDALHKCVVISCGLGEDASFDVEFAAMYNARMIIVDPTPRAINHFEGIMSRLGEASIEEYCSEGAQPVTAYNLTDIKCEQFQLCAKALWDENTSLRFFSPPNPDHVSHSLLNFQNNYSKDTAYIEVEGIKIKKLFDELNLTYVELIKLDIEGAEVEVLYDMLSENIFPRQILVEYDELLIPSKLSKFRIEGIHNALTNANYILVYREHTNYSYIRNI
jgi:FkbM family methyltransferase